MFSKKDIKVFDNQIDELTDISEELTDKVNKLSIDEQKTIIKIVEKYIKEKGLIVYGGNAQNLAIKRIKPKDVFYDNKDVHDYDVYSYDPKKDMVELSNRIYKSGFTNIIAIEAIHIETYSLKYFSTALCDMSYIPKYIFDNLPYYEVDGIKIVDPYFTYIDFMRMFNDPLTTSSFRWEKNFARFNMMQEYYPLKSKELIYNKIHNLDNDVLEYFDNKIKTSTTLFYTGLRVYNEYAKLCKCSDISLNYLTIISSNYVSDIKEIVKELKKKYKKKITTSERYPFFQFLDHSLDIKYNNKIICKIYGNNNICIPYKEINKIKYTSFTFNLMWIMIEKFYYTIYNAECNGRPSNYKEIEKNYDDIISGMLYMKEKYLKDNKKTILDNTIFQHFVVDKCSGIPKNAGEIRKEIKDYVGFKYDPSKNKKIDINSNYTNISGRFILNAQNKYIK